MYLPTLCKRLCAVLVCLFGLSGGLNVAYAAPTPGDQDLIRDRQNRLLEEQQRRLEELKDLPGKTSVPSAPVAPANSRCFVVKDIQLSGADSLSSAERERLLRPYLEQCLGVAQLNDLLKVITDHYIAKGLVTSRA